MMSAIDAREMRDDFFCAAQFHAHLDHPRRDDDEAKGRCKK